jgi:hypothetical protein
MGAKSITVVRAEAADFFFDCRAAEVPSDEWIRTYQGASTIMLKTLDWNRSRISMLEVEAVFQSCTDRQP